MSSIPIKNSLVDTNELLDLGNSARVRIKGNDELTSTQVLDTAKGILGVKTILVADNWTNDKTYSFEEHYPSRLYDAVIVPDIDAMTTSQKTEWSSANIMGTEEGEPNIITASGVVPTHDLPVIIQYAPVGSYL